MVNLFVGLMQVFTLLSPFVGGLFFGGRSRDWEKKAEVIFVGALIGIILSALGVIGVLLTGCCDQTKVVTILIFGAFSSIIGTFIGRRKKKGQSGSADATSTPSTELKFEKHSIDERKSAGIVTLSAPAVTKEETIQFTNLPEKKTIGVRTVIMWGVSISLILSGIGNSQSSIAGGLLILMGGILIFPPFEWFLDKRYNVNLTPSLKIVGAVFLVSAGGFVIYEDAVIDGNSKPTSGLSNMSGDTDSDGSFIQFLPSQLPPATVGKPYFYSFCKPDLELKSDLCGGLQKTTNPIGGHPPYHFEQGPGAGFPPFGISLNLNGILNGTPSAEGTRTFEVCAVDLDGNFGCQTVSLDVEGEEVSKPEGSITVNPETVKVLAPICFDKPCEVTGTFTITSTGPWYIDATFDHATGQCGDAPGGSYWAICPNVGGAGVTVVTLKNRVYGKSTPARFPELLTDGMARWTFRLKDDFKTSAEVVAYMELSRYE